MIKIVADTLSCLSPARAQELGVAYLPQIIIFGEESYRDDTEMTPSQFLKRLAASSALPKTAAPPPHLYTPIYRELLDQGHTVVVLTPPADVSGTYSRAKVAAEEFPGADIHVVDTQVIAGGLGALVTKAVEWAQEETDTQKFLDRVMEMANRHRVYFVVDTLEYLYKGGRIGAAKALFGSILQVKPILTFKDGHIEPFESQRTHKRAVARLKEVVLGDCPRDPSAHLCVMHGNAEEEAKTLAGEFSGLLGIPSDGIPIYEVPPAILVHAGPGVLAVSYFVQPGQP